jgi:hypothetical protein
MHDNAPMFASRFAGWTGTGIQPPGAWVTFEDSIPRRRGMEGPVRSMSRIPTEWPERERERASWVVMEDFPTPPLPDRTLLLVRRSLVQHAFVRNAQERYA